LVVVVVELETAEVLDMLLETEALEAQAAVLQWVILERNNLVDLEQQIKVLMAEQE
jgi:hypothetical protein